MLRLRRAWVRRGGREVLRGLDLVLPRGRHTVVLGPNGAGKSSFLALLQGELHPLRRAGLTFELFGQARWDLEGLRRRVGAVSPEQQRRFPPGVPAEDVVLSGLRGSAGTWAHQRYRAEERRRSAALMESLGVARLAGRPYGALSTGEQRRLLLARALVHRPELLLLDEPTAGLDPPAAFAFLETVRAALAREEGPTLVLVTHHLHEIPPEVRWAVLLRQGRVLAQGPKEELLRDGPLSELFGTPLRVLGHGGRYQLLPA